jgi:hypothetical protein
VRRVLRPLVMGLALPASCEGSSVMPLGFPTAWRFSAPKVGPNNSSALPPAALEELARLAIQLAGFSFAGTWVGLETFKKHLYPAAGVAYHGKSSDEGWAETDLRSVITELQGQPPLLIEGLVTAGRVLTDKSGEPLLSDAEPLNAILRKYNFGLRVTGDKLEPTSEVNPDAFAVPPLIERRSAELSELWGRSEQLLAEGRNREAAAASWTVVESVLLVFKGRTVGGAVVDGNHFNKIVKSLKNNARFDAELEPVFEQAVRLAERLQDYLSNPDTGGVRHGFGLDSAPKSAHEARLLIDFAKGLARYICSEYDRLTTE